MKLAGLDLQADLRTVGQGNGCIVALVRLAVNDRTDDPLSRQWVEVPPHLSDLEEVSESKIQGLQVLNMNDVGVLHGCEWGACTGR